ncbi:MAG: hypothetical protein LKE46_09645 [Clostridium sp.]|jgi:hypothetical protein|uniref:hypothetical protein n=1 Tax=Clostridium sp. TaxID=1506 RepID=UPI0025B837B8|nr:hypothetical protein [Clostridium sp.]MCH3964526.1 hypothetical protein [Clostridium sp.]MCI1714997.1 hypothetical protein [Clostridium sp.]MCI1799259.1 hypothetical protein [Clostridium sp.]MCI1813180.1 hypothetical protein [Clostridium sp.]MCI1870071.1 hypothetical protein [Clostridium sp.]
METLEDILKSVSIDNIDMVHMGRFIDDIELMRQRCESIKYATELKNIYKAHIDIGDELMTLYNIAKEKHKHEIQEFAEGFTENEEHNRAREKQNDDLNKEIRELKKKIKKNHDYMSKQEMQKKLHQLESLYNFNKKCVLLSHDQYGASILAKFDMFTELSIEVDKAYDDTDKISRKERTEKVIELIKSIAGTTPVGAILSVTDILKAVANFVNSLDNNLLDERFKNLDAEFEIQKEQYINLCIAYLLVKIYMGDLEFVTMFCMNAEKSEGVTQ